MKLELKNHDGEILYAAEAGTQLDAFNILFNGHAAKQNKFTQIRNVDFRGFDFDSAQFHAVDFRNCNFSDVGFHYANFNGCCFLDCTFSGADLRDASFSHTEIKYSQFVNTNTTGTKMYNCEVHSSDFSKTVYHRRMYVSECIMSRCTFPRDFGGEDTIFNSCTFSVFNERPGVTFSLSGCLVNHCRNLLQLGVRSDGYVFYLISNKYVHAGCRMFTIEEAKKHWGDEIYTQFNTVQNQRESMAFLGLIEVITSHATID